MNAGARRERALGEAAAGAQHAQHAADVLADFCRGGRLLAGKQELNVVIAERTIAAAAEAVAGFELAQAAGRADHGFARRGKVHGALQKQPHFPARQNAAPGSVAVE